MKKTRKLKKEAKILLGSVGVILFLIIFYFIAFGKVSNNNEQVKFVVETGSTYSTLAPKLKEENLIKSEFFYKIYIKLTNPEPLKTGVYYLSENMNIKKLVNELENNTKQDYISITFKEGIDFRDVIQLITKNTEITEEEIIDLVQDQKYLNELINKYWFLTEDIKNKDIYYSLEGYLFPDTYNFDNNTSLKEIFDIMLTNTEKKLEKYKDIKSNYSIHEMMTMASIVELEASNSDDRAGVAGVFYNRLESNWSLGSDVTTYYGLKLDLSERDLTIKELNEYNNYNTRSSKMAGKLPISPICMPSINSIEAAFSPEQHNYYYFVADKNGKTYFNKTSSGHTSTVSKLKSEGLWYTY